MSLPRCTGVYSVGCVDVMTSTNILPKDLHPNTLCNTNLGCFIRLYYPCKSISSSAPSSVEKAKWLPEPNQKFYSYGFAKYAKMKLAGWFLHKLIGNTRMEAYSHAPLIDQSSWKQLQPCPSLQGKENLPLIVFSHGMGGQRAVYSVYCTQLASEGYVVAALEHRDGSATTTFIQGGDGEVVEVPYYSWATATPEEEKQLMEMRSMQLNTRSEDVTRTLDLIQTLDTAPDEIDNCLKSDEFDIATFKGRIDTSSPLVMGHSFGGVTALQALKNDSRLKGAITLDPWCEPLTENFFEPDTKTTKPTLVIFTQYWNFRKNMRKFNKLMEMEKDYVDMVTLIKARHYDQCDIPAIIPSFVANFFAGRSRDIIDYNEGMQAQRTLISDYLWKLYGKQDETTPLQLLGNDYQLSDSFMVGSDIEVGTDEPSKL